MSLDEVRVALPQSATAAREARQVVRQQLVAWALDGVIDDVVLLVSEVVTNAVHHARSDIELMLALQRQAVRVEISDASSAVPVQQAMSHDALRGRGMGIVAAIAARWGVDPIPGDGKTVWFEVNR